MNTFLRTDEFDEWLVHLKDKFGKARIVQRLDAAMSGNFGDCESVGEGVHVGPGYRVYYMRREAVVYILLAGGTKSTQKRDIKRAIGLARELKKEMP